MSSILKSPPTLNAFETRMNETKSRLDALVDDYSVAITSPVWVSLYVEFRTLLWALGLISDSELDMSMEYIKEDKVAWIREYK